MLGIKSRVGMTGGSTRYLPLYEDRPNHDDQFKYHEYDYYNACEFRSRSASGQVPREFDSWGITISPAVVDLKIESTGSQVLVTQKAGTKYTQGDSG
jgi:hypothetical protein